MSQRVIIWLKMTSCNLVDFIYFCIGGYYTTAIHRGLRVIGLNTNLYYSQDKLTSKAEDPAGQFQWLTATLTAAKTAKEKVSTTGHGLKVLKVQQGMNYEGDL